MVDGVDGVSASTCGHGRHGKGVKVEEEDGRELSPHRPGSSPKSRAREFVRLLRPWAINNNRNEFFFLSSKCYRICDASYWGPVGGGLGGEERMWNNGLWPPPFRLPREKRSHCCFQNDLGRRNKTTTWNMFFLLRNICGHFGNCSGHMPLNDQMSKKTVRLETKKKSFIFKVEKWDSVDILFQPLVFFYEMAAARLDNGGNAFDEDGRPWTKRPEFFLLYLDVGWILSVTLPIRRFSFLLFFFREWVTTTGFG